MVREGVIAVDVGFHAAQTRRRARRGSPATSTSTRSRPRPRRPPPVPAAWGRSPTSGSWGTPWWPPRSRPTGTALGRGPDLASAFGTTYRFRAGAPGRAARWACLASAAILSITGIVAITRGASDAEWQVRLFLPPRGRRPSRRSRPSIPARSARWCGSAALRSSRPPCAGSSGRRGPTRTSGPCPVFLPLPARPAWPWIWWFIPFANLVMPYVCVRELSTISAARAGSTPRRGLPVVWWALFLAAAVASIVAAIWPWVLIAARVAEAGDQVRGITYVVDRRRSRGGSGLWHLLLAAAGLAGAGVVGDIERHQGSIDAGTADGPDRCRSRRARAPSHRRARTSTDPARLDCRPCRWRSTSTTSRSSRACSSPTTRRRGCATSWP